MEGDGSMAIVAPSPPVITDAMMTEANDAITSVINDSVVSK